MAHPVRGEQPERVPALGAPRRCHLAAFEHDVVEPCGGKVTAHRQAGLPGADDDDSEAHRSHRRSCSALGIRSGPAQARETWTVVGLVRMSKTAERFWDWARIASRSARLASASMSKVAVTWSKPLRTSPSMPR